jgi:hypothetical protein
VENRERESQRFREEMSEWDAAHPRPPQAYFAGLQRDGILRYAHPRAYEWLDARAAFEFDRTVEMADRVQRHRTQNQMPLARQQFAVDRGSVLAPFAGYRVLAKWLARATLDDKFEVARHGFRYRQTYIDYLRGRFAVEGWRRWYTDDPPGTPVMIADPQSLTEDMLKEDSPFMRERLAWAEDRWQRDRNDPRRHLDLSGLPPVGPGCQRPLPASLERMLIGLLIMILTLGNAVLLTVRRFMTYLLN